jgi:hypothetical protein
MNAGRTERSEFQLVTGCFRITGARWRSVRPAKQNPQSRLKDFSQSLLAQIQAVHQLIVIVTRCGW